MGIQDSFFRRAGSLLGVLGFNFKRNLYSVFGYNLQPGYIQFFAKYLRQDLAARVIDAPAAALWSNPPQVISNDPEWNTAWNDLVARQDLWSRIERADKLAGLGRFSILIIGFNDGRNLSDPVSPSGLRKRKNQILYVQPYSYAAVKVQMYETDTSSERFNKPLMYTVQPDLEQVLGFDQSGNKTSLPKANFTVHASRVIHICENPLENDVFGLPRMERVYNILDDLQKVTGGAAETFWLVANRGLHIDIDKEMQLQAADADALSDEIDEYENEQRRVIRTRGVKVTSLGSDTPDPRGVFTILISTLSGATGIPSRILIGSEAGQLASEQDRANWADRIDERRSSWGNPMVLHQLIKVLTWAGFLPTKDTTQITINWPSAFKMSPLEAAQTAAQHARSATNFAKAITDMHELNTGTPATPGGMDSFGKVTPSTPGVPPANLGDLVTVDEARKFIGLDKPAVTFDSGQDVGADGGGGAPDDSIPSGVPKRPGKKTVAPSAQSRASHVFSMYVEPMLILDHE